MYIKTLKIRNFRKLKEVAIDLQLDTTLFIGANNSGKTSVIAAMNLFLNDRIKENKFSHYDFSLANHLKINELFETETEPTEQDFDGIFPAIDLWFHIEDKDVHYISRLLPTLDWAGGDLGVRLRYEIKDISKLYSEYKTARDKVKGKNGLFQKDMMDYLSKHLSTNFEIRRYILDPAKKQEVQTQESLGVALDDNPLNNLLQINTINAQRGMNDEVADTEQSEKRKLTALMTNYYSAHLDPNKGEMTEEDVKALEELHKATETFTSNMRANFDPALKEISKIGYPPFGAPSITINPQVNATDGISHPNALQYKTENGLCLPEAYNGLGYQNLIFITFKMIGFRDSWIRYGKMQSDDTGFAPIHLVLIEEPEAHLHPQAQQVFIKKAYDILTDRPEIKAGGLTTQMIVSTHSSHITHECEFANLRYFKRCISCANESPITDVISLTNVFGSDKETERFVTRYIKINHCDLFFADAAILIEGDAERILMPYFIAKLQHLTQSYVCVLTIGGSHAHRLKPLMGKLCIPTLIITDLDGAAGGKTTNPTLKKWIPAKENVDDLLALTPDDKTQIDLFPLRVAYQTGNAERTFEDTLKNENKELTKDVKGDKAAFALNLLDLEKFDDAADGLKTPTYIEEGLTWLDSILQKKLDQKPCAENAGDENA
ncbi:MAG: AAA family ATPase [Azoarcus sp.]|jgi:predicted ATP-dependent endonuclease of OLD family|nr:AAA family ATPase [Azoarcus sp.]